jgi:hypothetical protein
VVMAKVRVAWVSVLCKHLFQSKGCPKLAIATGRCYVRAKRDPQSGASRFRASRRRGLNGRLS